jgi:hypothetical protein
VGMQFVSGASPSRDGVRDGLCSESGGVKLPWTAQDRPRQCVSPVQESRPAVEILAMIGCVYWVRDGVREGMRLGATCREFMARATMSSPFGSAP